MKNTSPRQLAAYFVVFSGYAVFVSCVVYYRPSVARLLQAIHVKAGDFTKINDEVNYTDINLQSTQTSNPVIRDDPSNLARKDGLSLCSNYVTDLWDFNCYVPCNETNKNEDHREQAKVACNGNGAYVTMEKVKRFSDVPEIPFNSPCSIDLIDICKDNYAVPNIVHYIWFSRRKMNVYHYLSFLSAYKFLKPCLIFVHGEFQPYGEYWEILLQYVPNIIHIVRDPPDSIYGKTLIKIEHKADIARLEALQVYGGIYLDTDEVILRSMDNLMNYPFTLSHALSDNLSNGLILSERNATFLDFWLDGYRNFNPEEWAYHSTILPYHLSKVYPELIHVENKTFVRPNYTQLSLIFKHNFDWSKNYAIHLYIRYLKGEYSVQSLKHLNTTIGSVARHVMFGSKEICFN